MSELSEEEIISPSDEVRIVNAFKYWYETNTEKGVSSIPDYICKDLLDLYNKEKMNSFNLSEQLNKEKEKNKELEKDISEMYYKGVVLDILQDELNISRDEAIEILDNY